MFLSRNKKNNVCPCKLQFYYVKVGFNGVISAQSDQSSLVAAAFNSTSVIQRGMNDNPCHTGLMYWADLNYCWSQVLSCAAQFLTLYLSSGKCDMLDVEHGISQPLVGLWCPSI